LYDELDYFILCAVRFHLNAECDRSLSRRMIFLDLLLDSVATSSAYWQLMTNFTWTSTRKQQSIILIPEWGGGGDLPTNSKNYFKQAVQFWESKHL
jgi:hypothetical protein